MKIALRMAPKVALLAGLDPAVTPVLYTDPSQFGDHWPAVVEALSLDAQNNAWLRLEVEAPTVEAVIAAVTKAQAKKAAKAAKAKAAAEDMVVALERALVEPLEPRKINVPYTEGISSDARIDGFRKPEAVAYAGMAKYDADSADRNAPVYAQIDRLIEQLDARVASENAKLIEAAMPRLREEFAIKDAARIAANEAEAAAKEARLAKVAAARLASGTWERETSSYSTKREGKPWCARVTGTDPKGRLIYEWGAWIGRPGEAGLLSVACSPGDIIAWGQRDQRRPERGEHHIMQMGDDGRMTTLSVPEAVRALREAGKRSDAQAVPVETERERLLRRTNEQFSQYLFGRVPNEDNQA